MNQADREELNKMRIVMWQMFQRVAKVGNHAQEIDVFVRAMDRHQEIIAEDVEKS